MVERVIIDLDDTLLETGKCFHERIFSFCEKLMRYVPEISSVNSIQKKQEEFDQELLDEVKLDLKRFPESLARTWKFFCQKYDRPLRQKHIDQSRKIGWDVYQRIPDPLDDMETTLDSLHDRFELVLYTMGNPHVQYKKIDHYDLHQWFSVLHVIPFKDLSSLRNVVHPYDAEYTAIIGDSLRTEIKPALELGMKAIHRQPEHTWHFHTLSLDGEFPSIQSLSEVHDHLP